MSTRSNRVATPLLWILVLLGSINISNAQTLEILPLGNSITRGSMCLNGDIYNCERLDDGDAIGYRKKLYSLLSDAGYNVDYIGSQHYGWRHMLDTDNAGFSGITVENLASVIETGTSASTGQVTPGPYLNYYPADVVLLHIGTNNTLFGTYNVANHVERILDAIDAYEVSNNRPILVLLAKIISEKDYPCGTHYATAQFNSLLGSMAQTRINNGDKLVVVDMECGAGLDYYNDLIDQAHPNQVGYDKMADKWFQVINSFNTAPVVSQIPDQSVSRGSSFAPVNLDLYVTDAEDPDQDITWSVYPSVPQHFSITIANRVATITPLDPDWVGSETVEFVAMDQGKVITALQKTGNCYTQFAVGWVPEIIGQQPLSTPQRTPLTVTVDDLVIVDPENAPPGLEVVVSQGSNYTVEGPAITPAPLFIGELTVPVKIMDGATSSNTFNLSVTVIQVNYPPEITSSPVVNGETNQVYSYQVMATDPDPDDVLTYSASVKPGWLYMNPATGLLSGTPAATDAGNHNITVVVSDGDDEDVQSYILEVVLVNHPPQILTEPEDTAIIGETYSYGIQASDPEGGSLVYFAQQLPTWLDFYPQSRVMIGVPDYPDAGKSLVILGVTDLNDTTYQAFELFVISPTGLGDHIYREEIRVYPNPATSYIMVEVSDPGAHPQGISFELFDLAGARIMHTILRGPASEIRLNETGVGAGLYIYRVTDKASQGGIQVGRVMINSGER